MLHDLDLDDAINAEIWANSRRIQAAISDAHPEAAADILQAVLAGGPLPWVPDLVGRDWKEAGSLFVVGSAYAPFLDTYAGRARAMSEHTYRRSPTPSAFQRSFVRDVVSDDTSYYGPLLQLLRAVGLSPRRAVLLDLVRGSFVKLANFEGGDGAITVAPALFSAYMAAGWHWTWRRLRESSALDIVVLGGRAERGFLTMLSREGLTVRVALGGEPVVRDDNILSAASARGVAGWLRDGTWWEATGRVDGRERRWRILPIVHPARVNQHDARYVASARLLRRMLSGAAPEAPATTPSPTRVPQRRAVGPSLRPDPGLRREGDERSPQWMPGSGRMTQRDAMRRVWARFGPSEERVVAAYAAEERAGTAPRASNMRGESPEEYARRLLYDGIAKGWLGK